MSGDPQGFEPIGLGLRPNDGTGDAPRVVGDKLNRMLRGVFARLEASEAALEEAQAVIAELLAGGGGVTPTPTPTPAPSFSVLPAIVAVDGDPHVGDVVALDRGVHNGALGTIELQRLDGLAWITALADASIGSHQLAAAGSYRLRERIGTTAVYGESAVVDVTIAPVDLNPIPAPTVRLDPDRDPTSNPMHFVVDFPSASPGDKLQARYAATVDGLSAATWHTLVGEVVYQNGNAFSLDVTLPSGAIHLQFRLLVELDDEGEALQIPLTSLTSEILYASLGGAGTGVVYDVTLDPEKSYKYADFVFPTDDKLTVRAAEYEFRASSRSTRRLLADEGFYEFRWDDASAVNNVSTFWGVTADYDPSASVQPDFVGEAMPSIGYHPRSNGFIWNGDVAVDGAHAGWYHHRATGRYWVITDQHGWLPNYPWDANGELRVDTGFASGITDPYALLGPCGGQQLTVNFGGQPLHFADQLHANAKKGWA